MRVLGSSFNPKNMHILIFENPSGWICTLNQPPLNGDGYISHNT